jgi:N4-(beta-N-acetylglucosaminyl)-L-asparaginase
VSLGLSRRAFFRQAGLLGGAALGSTGAAAPVPRPAGISSRPIAGRTIMVGSANALPGMNASMHLLSSGADPLGAVLDAIHVIEDDADDVTVGYGGIPNEDGVVELDASVMEGATLRSGAVGALRSIRHPSTVARLVMDRSDRVFLVGEGALRFARAHGLPEENLLTERSRKIWLYWKEKLSGHDDWVEAAGEEDDPDIRWFVEKYGDEDFRPQGTVHISALSPDGHLHGCTSTSGLFFKIPGRLGDSPVIGAGLYTDDRAGSCGSTGRGEATIATCGSHTVVEFMRQGLSPEESALRALRRIVESEKDPRHLDADGRPRFQVKFYCMDTRGTAAGASIWGGAQYAVHDGTRGTLRESASLFPKPPKPL